MPVAPSPGSGGEALWQDGPAVVVGRATRADAGAWRCAGVDRVGKTVTGKPMHLLIYGEVTVLLFSEKQSEMNKSR